MAPPVSLVLAFKQPMMMIGVRCVLSQAEDVSIVAECATLAATLRAIKQHRPRVVLAGTGISESEPAALESLVQASADTRLALFCTRWGDMPEHALLRGASAALPAESAPEHLIDCVRALGGGRRWRAPAAFRPSGRRGGRRRDGSTILAVLSVRERQIAHAVASGKRNREIADAFGIAPGTVKLHLNRIYSKLGVNSRLALFKKLVSEANLPL